MNKTILVVDDNRAATEIAQIMLEAHGYTVHTAHDGQEALACIGKHVPDLIILDIMMPQMSGTQVLQLVREMPATTNVPVIMCTAKDQDADLLEGYRLGADYYITKPFTAQQLLYGVGMLLDRSQPARS